MCSAASARSPRMVEKFIEVLALPARRPSISEAMVRLIRRSRNGADRSDGRPPPHSSAASAFLNSDAYEYYAKWYHSALFAIDVMDVTDDPRPFLTAFFPHVPVGSFRIRSRLQRLGLVRKNEAGFWKPTKDSISSGPYNNDELVRQYQLQCFELSKQALCFRPKKASCDEHDGVQPFRKKPITRLETELQGFQGARAGSSRKMRRSRKACTI